MEQVVGITGTPGTGKKTLAPLVASKLGLPCVGLNDLAIAHGLAKPWASEAEIDPDALKKSVAEELRGPALVHGHLLAHVLDRRAVARVVVLRCEPTVLKQRLLARRYGFAKVLENIEAELIGVVSSDAHRAFGERKTVEFDTSSSDPATGATAISDAVRRREGPSPTLDWTLSYDSAARLRSLLSPSSSVSALT